MGGVQRAIREELLCVLESVKPGLAKNAIIEQSDCFVFKDGRVHTYNDSIACSAPSPLGGYDGAVRAAPLLAVLEKMPDEWINVTPEKGGIVLSGRRRASGIRTEAEVVLPVDALAPPGDGWHPLPVEFEEAVELVEQCASKNDSMDWRLCVHMNPEYIEAADGCQFARYRINTGVEERVLVRRSSLAHVVGTGVTEVARTKGLIHFRTPEDLVLSLRTADAEYPDMETLTKLHGTPLALADRLADVCERAEIFSKDNADANEVTIQLRPGKIRVKGEGKYGHYSEVRDITYDGPGVSFRIGPRLLAQWCEKYNECEVSDRHLIVRGEDFVYVASVGTD